MGAFENPHPFGLQQIHSICISFLAALPAWGIVSVNTEVEPRRIKNLC